MLAVCNTHPRRSRSRGSEPRRAFHPSRRQARRGSDCRKVLHTPGSCCIRARGRGRENIFEQINGSETPTYLHHDQQGSTRLITGSTGTVEGKCSYSAYGTSSCEGTVTTPFGYDGQYTSSDTGLIIYMGARVYDPATAQFLSVDPFVGVTGAPYNYAGDNPVNNVDPTGLSSTAEGLGEGGVPCYFPFCGPSPAAEEALSHGVENAKHGIESVWNAVNETKDLTTKVKRGFTKRKRRERIAVKSHLTSTTQRNLPDLAGSGTATVRWVAMKVPGLTLIRVRPCIQIWLTESRSVRILITRLPTVRNIASTSTAG